MFTLSVFFLLVSTIIQPLHAIPSLGLSCLAQYEAPQLRYPPPSVRVPPNGNYHGMRFNHWTLPQPQDLYGTYYVTHSSRQSYISLVNMRSEHYPVFPQSADFPPGSEINIVSWSTCADPNVNCTDPSAITTVFGYFKPLGAMGPTDQKPAATWNYSSTGILSQTTNFYSLLGFGTDTNGDDYLVQFETGYAAQGADPTNAIPCINIVSRNEHGPSQITFQEIIAGLTDIGTRLQDDQFVQISTQTSPLKTDGRRMNEGPVQCDYACTQNQGLIPHR